MQAAPTPATRIDVLICTFRRPHLRETLASLAAQKLPAGLSLGVMVADNDVTPTAEALCRAEMGNVPFPLHYLHAPARNISIARNALLAQSTAPWVAFIDDDEVAAPDWIAALWQSVATTGADAVFGPAVALYPPTAPAWMVTLDSHSNLPERRRGVVLTGHTCNALLRWSGSPWQDCRFDLGRGRSGGEDTAFFFAIARRGARFAEAPAAIVREAVAPDRLTLRWLLRRRFRMGQSYASSAASLPARAALFGTALCKALFCAGAALAVIPSATRRRSWAMRGALHAGVVAGCLSLPQPQAYGGV